YEFQLFHGEYINRSPGVFSKLIEAIKNKFPSIDNFVISCYVRTRTFMRMKSLNLKKSEQKRLVKKRTASEQRQKSQ
ncbi:hypothetical protein, partial [Klebsiella pneumoniae]|uniref:hypothetical protein n=1 Tax=Klebsiella pneumoniae TaxID=573 RepID=UPI0040556129